MCKRNYKATMIKEGEEKTCCECHLNSLGSLGYCIAALGLTAFIITTEVQQFFKYKALPWNGNAGLELNIHLGLVCCSALLIPFFFYASVFKVGNLANDGYRLGIHDGVCSTDKPPLPSKDSNLCVAGWRHMGPVGPLLHIIFAHFLIAAKTLMEAAVIREDFVSKQNVWHSELSMMLPQASRLIIFQKLGLIPLDSQRSVMDLWLRSEGDVNHTRPTVNSLWSDGDSWHVGEVPWGIVTPHFLNFLFGYVIYAGRYAGIFWGTNKNISLAFLLQLMLNVAFSVLALNGFQVLYKVQIVKNTRQVFPIEVDFILPVIVSVAVYLVLQTVVLSSGCVTYLYAYSKFDLFLCAEKEKYHILTKHGQKSIWPYWPHCWSLIFLVMFTAAASPLIYDWSLVYRASLDSATVIATCAAIVYAFTWIILWIGFMMKTRWHFKLRVQVSKTIVSNTHSIRLVNEVHLSHQAEDYDGPVMVIGSGKTYLLQEEMPKKSIMKLVRSNLTDKKSKGEEEEIYWLRPKAPQEEDKTWKKKSMTKNKVTFNEDPSLTASSRGGTSAVTSTLSEIESAEESEGEYAQLRNVRFPGPKSEILVHKQPNNMNRMVASVESVGSDFPAPPPELSDPSTYPPPPGSPPPPLPMQQYCQKLSTPTEVARRRSDVTGRNIANEKLGVKDSQLHIRSGNTLDYQDTSSNSSATPPDKRSDSGVHSQTSGSSSLTHSKSGSSGSESCVPIERPQVIPEQEPDLPPPPPSMTNSLTRCSSVDELCSLPPVSNVRTPCVKSYSLQHGTSPQYAYQSQENSPNHYTYRFPQEQFTANGSFETSYDVNGKIPNQYQEATPNDMQLQYLSQSDSSSRRNIEVVEGGYNFLPPTKFIASEPIYSDESTPVVIRRRSSVTAIEPETPPYERSAASFSTFTDPPMTRAMLKNNACFQALAASSPGKAITVGGPIHQLRRPVNADVKHYTISGGAPILKGFHHPAHIDTRYFSIQSGKPQDNYASSRGHT